MDTAPPSTSGATGVRLNVASLVIACVWLVMIRRQPETTDVSPPSLQLLLRITAASSLLALVMIPISWIPPENGCPAALLVLMPGRYLNFGATDLRGNAHRTSR